MKKYLLRSPTKTIDFETYWLSASVKKMMIIFFIVDLIKYALSFIFFTVIC